MDGSANKGKFEMFRKSLLTVIAATTLSLGLGASSTPADAKVFISLGFGSPYYYGDPYYYGGPYYYGYYHGCTYKRVKVKVWSHKKHRYVNVRSTRRVCY
jgi:hypothetical protein